MEIYIIHTMNLEAYSGDDHKSISGSIVVDLEVGDTFDVRVTYNTMYSYHGNGFTGFYLSP
jgi:hypothetical protein